MECEIRRSGVISYSDPKCKTVNEIYLQPLDPGRSGYEIRSGVQFLEGIQIFSLSHNCDETKEPFLFQLPSPNLPFYLFKREDL